MNYKITIKDHNPSFEYYFPSDIDSVETIFSPIDLDGLSISIAITKLEIIKYAYLMKGLCYETCGILYGVTNGLYCIELVDSLIELLRKKYKTDTWNVYLKCTKTNEYKQVISTGKQYFINKPNSPNVDNCNRHYSHWY